MSGRGRRASFPDLDDEDAEVGSGAVVRTLDSRRFRVRVDGGGELALDLSSWPHPSFTASIAPILQELVRGMGPAPVMRTVRCKVLDLRRFWRFLDEAAITLCSIDDVTADLIDRYEDWLEQNTPSQAAVRRLIAPLIGIMRLAVENEPDRFPKALANRLTWLGRGELAGSRPRDAYSSGVTAALRTAARNQVAEAAKRVLIDEAMPARRGDIEACPALHRHHDDVIALLAREGSLGTHNPTFWRLKGALWNRKMPALSSEDLHGQLYLTRIDLIGFLVALSLQTGMEIECLRSLKADCLRNPSRGYVEIEYRKRRARGAEWKRLRVRDGGSSTPGGIIRQAIRLTERARRYLGTDALWAWWNGYGLRGPKISRRSILAFVARHGLTADDGSPLHLELSRLRKTQKAERYLHTQGQLEDFAVGHTIAVAARHYADIPALRHVHENTIADALRDALDSALKPKLMPPAIEKAVRASPEESGLPVPPDQVGELLDGEQDVWLASCAGFHASPFGQPGEACPTPFWGCLECANAVITARKLPALIAFDTFMIGQRALMDERSWAARFGRAHRRIVEQILPAFPPQVVAEARAAAEKPDTNLIYMPPEAYAS
ncbi:MULTISPECIES: hypothetical protein [unclassified Bradyrhizobium]|uniref:hypothetical protein n=1 Tax=unclassified Bradyrhizobium TaxID=2631580 RepID=UPI002478CCB5|nr:MULTISPECIES: hypothetical protein [unclassified Bradyrhizobium]WGR70331.1 hypothetical protein MTX24_33920 [Bradyrhizobium sp. ISRA426]WGR82390.1 hypothetical protein MTX21_19025 [Bradyrhizobium sp. ISRA430]WGR85576.1 hypothetical protein MTX25_33605 [Bradyrhizobium sp. ISRA432]